MKKIIAILMMLVMVFAMGSVVYAEDNGNVAEVNNIGYSSIQEAVDAAADGDVVTVTQSHEIKNYSLLDGSYNTAVKVEGKTVTIDLNGKELTCEYNESGMLVGFFSTDNGGHLTLVDSKGGAVVNVKAISTVYSLIVNYEGGCSLTIKGGSYILDKAKDSLAYTGSLPKDFGGKQGIFIEGGNFHLGNEGTGSNGSPWIFNAGGQNTSHVVVTGGTFNTDVNHQHWAHEVSVNKNLALKENGDGKWTVVEAAVYVNEPKSGYGRYVGYSTLSEAVKALKSVGQENKIIYFFRDLTTDETVTVEEEITINLDGYSLGFEGEGKIVLKGEGAVHGSEGLKAVPFSDGYAVTYQSGKYSLVAHDDSHETEIINAKAAKCAEEGYTGDKYCNTCSGYLEYGNVIPALNHKDENHDHICENGCGLAQGVCEDKNFDHICDYGYGFADGCDKVHGEHKDADKDHDCDYGCDETIGTCEDKDLDHACDYGCDKAFGEHKDADKDHNCDYGCSEKIGECEIDGEWVVIRKPGCEINGIERSYCEYGCGRYEERKIKASHDYEEGVCESCGKVSGIDYISGVSKPKEENESNPNTGAPVVSVVPVLTVAAAIFFKRK